MKVRPKIYVAGPISAATKQKMKANVDRALRVGRELMDRGYAPFVPHLDWFLPDRDVVSWETWLEIDTPWVRASDAVLRIPGESKGADLEVRIAKRNGVPVFESVDELDGFFYPRRVAAETVP